MEMTNEMKEAVARLRKSIKARIEPSEMQRLARTMAVHAAMSFSADECRYTTASFRHKIAGRG